MAHDAAIEHGRAEGLEQERAHLLRSHERGEQLQRRDRVQPRAVAADQLERGREQLRRAGGGAAGREEVDAEEGEEDGGGGRVRVVDALAVLFGFGEVLEAVDVDLERAVMPAETAEEDRFGLEEVCWHNGMVSGGSAGRGHGRRRHTFGGEQAKEAVRGVVLGGVDEMEKLLVRGSSSSCAMRLCKSILLSVSRQSAYRRRPVSSQRPSSADRALQGGRGTSRTSLPALR